ncbi:hypothetical protein ABBQ38_002093 [Trebouxia sp. C0009 RCD-2024]
MWQYLSKVASRQQDVWNVAETESSSSSSTSGYSWSRLSSYVYEKAADVAFDLAPVEQNLPLLRASSVLVELSHLVYATCAGDLSRTTHVDLPLLGSLSNRTTVACKLLHFREAAQFQHLQSPQQYAVWHVEGLGLVVAFRGTSSWDDVFVDINVRPTPLISDQGVIADTRVHSGFWEGAKQHVEDIKQVVQQQNRQAHRRLPVWITGHSLGGGYANCVMLHLLANKRTADLFSAGGGSVTFGAPMVLYSEAPAEMYKQLHALARAAQGRGRRQKLHYHNYVNNADAVPRFLGGSLNTVHQALESYIPSMSAVRETSQHFLPFGVYHFVHGSQIRTPHPPGSSAASHAAYAEHVCQHLDARHLLKIAYLTGFQTGGLMDHKMVAYQQRIRHHMDQLAMAHPSNRFTETIQPEREDEDPAKLFDMLDEAEQQPSLQTAVLNAVAEQLGAVGKSAMADLAPQVGNAAVAAASSRWANCWQKSGTSSAT